MGDVEYYTAVTIIIISLTNCIEDGGGLVSNHICSTYGIRCFLNVDDWMAPVVSY